MYYDSLAVHVYMYLLHETLQHQRHCYACVCNTGTAEATNVFVCTMHAGRIIHHPLHHFPRLPQYTIVYTYIPGCVREELYFDGYKEDC